jgi:hypothetical protein
MMIDHCYGETHLTKPLSNEPIGVASKLAEVSRARNWFVPLASAHHVMSSLLTA